MEKEILLKYDLEKGYGEMFFAVCPSCWNPMSVTYWEDGTNEVQCPVCAKGNRRMWSSFSVN
jgi:Zn ribbon nucleic-acid-binding protein